MSEHYLFAIIILQWLFLVWIVMRFGAERMKLSEEREALVNQITSALYASNASIQVPVAQGQYADTIMVPHPDRPEQEYTFHHYGNGNYGPVPGQDVIINEVDEVEGALE
jgi:hypothetical protein